MGSGSSGPPHRSSRPPGKDGTNGKDGKDGKDGATGPPTSCMTCNGNDAVFNGNINMTAATKNRFNYGVGGAGFFIEGTGFIGANSIQTADLTVSKKCVCDQ